MLRRKLQNDSGFTALELSVTILIIGVIASALIVITLNRDKELGNNSVTTTVQNVVSSVKEGLKKHPEATYFAITDDTVTQAPEVTDKTFDGKTWGNDRNNNGKIIVWVGTNSEEFTTYITEVQSKGANIAVIQGEKPGTFQVAGVNHMRGDYTLQNPYLYDSLTGLYNN